MADGITISLDSAVEDPQQELLEFVKEENLAEIGGLLLTDGAVNVNYNYSGSFGTCLHLASKSGSEGVVKLLLQHGADTEVRDPRCWTPLHYAVDAGHAGIVQLLLEHAGDANARTDMERSCLHLIALRWQEKPDVCQRMLEIFLAVPNLAVDDRDCSLTSPLLLAAMNRAGDMCKRLLDRGADVSCEVGPHCSRTLIEKHFPDILSESAVQLSTAIERDPGQQLYEALVSGDIIAFNNALTRIEASSYSSRLEALERLHGGITPLHMAVDKGMEAQVKSLLAAGCEPLKASPRSGFNALHYACFQGFYLVLALLIDQLVERSKDDKLELNARDSSGETVLHKLAKAPPRNARKDTTVNHIECLYLIMNSRLPIIIDMVDNSGKTALDHATSNGYQIAIQFLKTWSKRKHA